ncbi:MAG: excinuclease ABC subunit UvrC [Alphaproteobacteria bacterium]|nr:excinuclease ABC subunit UvrC [Alphaproteobacteria bacterium]
MTGEGISVPAPRGAAAIAAALKTMPLAPGVYRMTDAKGEVLYVGKAKSLRKRVAAYAKPLALATRIRAMVARTVAVEIVTTHTEAEALLLESNLIKRLKPYYNVLLRDDKSFPYILITGDHPFPQIVKHRGARARKGDYFGPFASALAVNRTLGALQRAFPLRSCSDSIFEGRTRPCLQYQIKRCTAPCVGRMSETDYRALVEEARDFLAGRSQDMQKGLAAQMREAADRMDFETAVVFRDRIRALTQIQQKQDINVRAVGEADVIAAHAEAGEVAIQVFFYRAGQNYGNRAYHPAHAKDVEVPEVLGAFIGQFYDNKPPPRLVLLSHPIEGQELVAEALAIKAGRKVEVHAPQRGERRALVDLAVTNAREALGRRLAESASQSALFEGIAQAFDLDEAPKRIEVYDNSHIQGRQPFGCMIVAGPEGFIKSGYRKFAIREAPAGDDYAMLRETLKRRFGRLVQEDADRDKGLWPDLVLIDGGQGQLGVAREVLAELGIDDLPLVAIAKGPDRNAGRERFFLPDRPPLELEPRDPVLYGLQRLRDEAHRFAIGAHRKRRQLETVRSELDSVAGVGLKRKRALLNHFGSAKAVAAAGIADLAAVEGVSRKVAETIYRHFHPEG